MTTLVPGKFANPYQRTMYGNGWDRSEDGSTRDKVLKRDLTDITYSADRKTILTGTLVCPYSGATCVYKRGLSTVDVDHIIPLSFAYKRTVDSWTSEKRKEFANDMRNLILVSAGENRMKGDKGPTEYLPLINVKSYLRWFYFIANQYKIPLTNTEKDIIFNVVNKGQVYHIRPTYQQEGHETNDNPFGRPAQQPDGDRLDRLYNQFMGGFQ